MWGYTAAQIELMVVDAPLVVYPSDKNKVSKDDLERTKSKWEKKYKGKESMKVDLSDVLSGKEWQS